jgi:hypothetical protein
MAQSYRQRSNQINEIQKQRSQLGRDVAPLPKASNPERRESCRRDFRRFCETYFRNVFCLEWSADHLRVIQLIEDATLKGGLFAVAMPRGSGKTSLAICAAEWALLYGHRSFVVLIGASEDAACDLLDHVKADFESNPLLAEDFPEVCHPISKLEGITLRAAGQLLDGERTMIGWTAKELVLPTVKGSVSSGARVKVAGITGRIRGMSAKRQSDGATIRPDFVLIDDPQTDESARSAKQVGDRLNMVNGAILGLAGPGKTIAGVMPVTVIARGDMADQVLNRKTHPEWQGERIKLLKSEPTNLKLWEQYAEHRANGMREGRDLADATAFYLANRDAMDAGAEASWPARYNKNEASAVQHAVNLKLRDPASFAAEYQNEPITADAMALLNVTPDLVASKVLPNLARGVVQKDAVKLTAFIDVQGKCLFYGVCGWDKNFGGHVVDYGVYPEQAKSYFTINSLDKTFADLKELRGVQSEGQLYAALKALTTSLLSRRWQTETDRDKTIDRLVIDSGYGSDVVKQFVRESAYTALILPSKGFGISAEKKPFNEYREEPGVRTGWNWRHKVAARELQYDTNGWKSFLAERLLTAPGVQGNLTLFKGNPTQHRLISEHVSAEYPVAIEDKASGRVVNEWKLRPNRENHWLDCLVGCAVAASEQGILFLGHQKATGQINRKRKKLNVTY